MSLLEMTKHANQYEHVYFAVMSLKMNVILLENMFGRHQWLVKSCNIPVFIGLNLFVWELARTIYNKLFFLK